MSCMYPAHSGPCESASSTPESPERTSVKCDNDFDVKCEKPKVGL
jgi:hypothetical protein